jgi:hypothetical protein
MAANTYVHCGLLGCDAMNALPQLHKITCHHNPKDHSAHIFTSWLCCIVYSGRYVTKDIFCDLGSTSVR